MANIFCVEDDIYNRTRALKVQWSPTSSENIINFKLWSTSGLK